MTYRQPMLCIAASRAGFRITCIDHEGTIHDLGMTKHWLDALAVGRAWKEAQQK